MERRVFFLCLLSFLMFAEGLSWIMAGGLGPCLVAPEHSEQAAKNDNHQDCPSFFAGTLLVFERGAEVLKRNDNDKAVVAGFTIVLAISTIGLWLATNRLWTAGERQLSHLSDTAERQLRAYVLPIRATAKVMKLGHVPEITVQLKNSGQTPAYGVTNSVSGGFQRPGDPDAVLRWERTSKATIAPNTRFYAIGGKTTMRPLTQASFDGVTEGRFIFYIYGETRYMDAFGNNRATKYRYLLDDRTGLREGRMVAAPEGNSSD
jgi:hypothetical protein